MIHEQNILQLQEFIPYRLNRAAEDISQRFAKHYKQRYGIGRPEWRTLATLGQFMRMTATDIATHSAMHKTKVSRAVWSLEEKRWLKRFTDDNDRRVEHLELTPEGRAVYVQLVDIARAFEAELSRQMGAEARNALVTALKAIERLDPVR